MNVLLGPTLSGKTSLMRVMAGLDVPTKGRLIVNGRDVTGTHVRRRSVAMVYQQFINYPGLSVYENIASPLRVKGIGGNELDLAVRSAAEILKLEPFLSRLPLELSGGQQQRCAIARALAKNAQLVLLDEPLANLDYKLREELREELPRIFAASGAHLRLRDNRTNGGVAAWGLDRLPLAGSRRAVRFNASRIPQAARSHCRKRIFRSTTQRDASREARFRSAPHGWRSGARHRIFERVPDGRYALGSPGAE